MSENTQHATVKMGSDRNFGLVFSLIFFLIGMWPVLGTLRTLDVDLIRALDVHSIRFWGLWVSVAFLVPAFVMPGLLHPLNIVWFRFGLFLGGIVAPVVMGLIYFLTVTPTGLLMRLFGKDLLRTRLDPSAKSYWVKREKDSDSAPEGESSRRSMKEPF